LKDSSSLWDRKSFFNSIGHQRHFARPRACVERNGFSARDSHWRGAGASRISARQRDAMPEEIYSSVLGA